MERRKSFIKISILIVLFCILISTGKNVKIYAATGNTYVYLVGGRGTLSQYDINKMEKVISANKMTEYSGKKKYTKYIFDADNKSKYGTKKLFNKNLSGAYKGITKNDTAVFVYSGHGMEDSNNNGIGLALGGESYYRYKDLAKKISSIKCRNMLVIINACGAGGFYKLGYKSFSNEIKDKITIFLSSANDQSSYRDTLTPKGAYFIDYIAAGLGYYKGVVFADSNADNQVTVEELAMYVNLRTRGQGIEGIKKMDPEFYSDHRKDVLYKYNGIKASLMDVTLHVGESLTISPSVSGIKNKKGTWTSSDPSIFSVNANGDSGKLVGKKSGTATLTYKINTTAATSKIKVEDTLNMSTLQLNIGERKHLLLLDKSILTKDATWSSSNSQIATVKDGKVTGKKTGKCTITVRYVTGQGGKVTATCQVTVATKSTNLDIKDMYPDGIQKVINYLIKNGRTYTANNRQYYIKQFNWGRDKKAIFLYWVNKKTLGVKDEMLEMTFYTNANDQNIRLSWYRIVGNTKKYQPIALNYYPDNSHGLPYALGSIYYNNNQIDFTRNSKIQFTKTSYSSTYSLEELNKMANEILQESIPYLDICMVQYMNTSMKEAGFTKYKFYY